MSAGSSKAPEAGGAGAAETTDEPVARRFSFLPRTRSQLALLVLSVVGFLSIVAAFEVFDVNDTTLEYHATLERSVAQRAQIRRVYSSFQDAELAYRAYVQSPDDQIRARFDETRQSLVDTIAGMSGLFADSPEQRDRAETLTSLATHRIERLDRAMNAAAARSASGAGARAATRPLLSSEPGEIRRLVTEMISFEEREIAFTADQVDRRIRVARNTMLGLLGAIVVLITATVLFGLYHLSQLSRVEDELRGAVAASNQASDAKTQFLASMSHEIRTPLTGVLGYTELLLDEDLSPRQREYAERLQRAGEGLSVIVNDILDFSKIEAGEMVLESEPFSLATAIDNALSICAVTARKKELELRRDVDPDLPPMVVGDQGRLKQILLNLLTNAVKFTERGSVTLSVRRESHAADRSVIRFAVTDTGIGIPADKQDLLFRRFSQVDSSIQRDYGGTGLGLAICKNLAHMMGGEIGVESSPGRGSTFWFTVALPVAGETAAAQPEARAAPGPAGARILLIEDSLQNQDLVTAILRDAGWVVDIANDGEEGVAAVQTQNYALILMDMQMPRMDGVSATRAIRRLPAPASLPPIIAMTANVMPQQLLSFRRAGVDDYIAKPFKKAHLIAKVSFWTSSQAREATAAPDRQAARDGAAIEEIRRLLGDDWLRKSLRRLDERLDHALSVASVDAPDLRDLARRAHELVSDSGQLGFVELSERFSRLERACAGDGDWRKALASVRRAAKPAQQQIDWLLASLERE